MGELKDKFNKIKGKRNQAGSPPYFVNELLEDIVDKVESGTGSGNGSSTYPIERVVLDENTQSVTLKPNVWYDINHSNLESLSINYSSLQEFYNIDGIESYISFKIVNEEFKDLESSLNSLLNLGGVLTKTNDIQGYKYKLIPYMEMTSVMYFSENPNNVDNCNIFLEGLGELNIYDIKISKELYEIYLEGSGLKIPAVEVDSDILNKYKYNIISMEGANIVMYCDAPIYECEIGTIMLEYDEGLMEIGETTIKRIILNNIYIENKNINEFVFTINTPINISSQYELYFNGDNIPDYSAEGKLTISIIDGVACWTFKPN